MRTSPLFFARSVPFEQCEATGLFFSTTGVVMNLGDVATHTARSTFAKSLLRLEEFGVEGNDGFDSADCVGGVLGEWLHSRVYSVIEPDL